MRVSDTEKNRGAHGDSSFKLGGMPSSSENPPALAVGSAKSLEEISAYPREWLTCQQVSGVLNCNPYALHVQAVKDQSKLGFPVVVIGNRVKIPKRAFIEFMRG